MKQMLVSKITRFSGSSQKVLVNQSMDNRQFAMLMDSIHKSYMSECIGNIHDPTAYPELKTYKLFKEEFKFENYLSSTKRLNHTLSLFRFRISSHNLRIETGRYTRPKIPVNQRMCIYCTSQTVETESHFLLECSLFIKERMDFLETIYIYLPVINNNYATNEHKIVAIMSSDEKSVTDPLGKFIYTCLNKRNTCTAITIKRPRQST